MWQKSSFCRFDSPQCVEVRGLDGSTVSGLVEVKMSEMTGTDDDQPLTFTREEWQAFIDGVKAGDFDLKTNDDADAEDQMDQV